VAIGKRCAPEAEANEPPDPDLRVLMRKKANYARRDDRIELRWIDGVLAATEPARGIFAAADRQHAVRVFLDLLDKTMREGQFVSHSVHAGNYAPRLFAKRPEKEGRNRADFERAMQALFAADKIKVGERRGPDRKFYQILQRREP